MAAAAWMLLQLGNRQMGRASRMLRAISQAAATSRAGAHPGRLRHEPQQRLSQAT